MLNPVLAFIKNDRWQFKGIPQVPGEGVAMRNVAAKENPARIGLCPDGSFEALAPDREYLLVLLLDHDSLEDLGFLYTDEQPVWGLGHINAPINCEKFKSLTGSVRSYRLANQFNHTPNDQYWKLLRKINPDTEAPERLRLALQVRKMAEAKGCECLTLSDELQFALRQQITRLGGWPMEVVRAASSDLCVPPLHKCLPPLHGCVPSLLGLAHTHAPLLAQLLTACRIERWSADPSVLRLVSVDHEDDGRATPLAGVDRILKAMRTAAAARRVPPAVLVVGLHSEAELRDKLRTRYGSGALLDWPGLCYLQFLFNEDDLVRAAIAAVQGRNAPLPLPSRAELLRCLHDVLHWVDRQRDVAAGQADNCALVRDGRLHFTPAMLLPTQRVLSSHHDLFAHLIACVNLSPVVSDPVPTSNALTAAFGEMLQHDTLIETARQDAVLLQANPPDLSVLERAFTAYERAAKTLTGRLAVLLADVAAGEPDE